MMAQNWLIIACCAFAGCSIATSPPDVFDSYIEAYAAGDVEQLWTLSSPRARLDSDRVRRELLMGLEHPDMPVRVHFEGTFGVTADQVKPMNRQQFFYWAVAMVRRRLGVGFIRSTMRRTTRVRIDTIDHRHKVVIYRQGDAIARLVLVATKGDIWRVDQSPFFPEVKSPKRTRIQEPDKSDDADMDDDTATSNPE